MSPAFAGGKQQWQIEPGDVVVLDLEGKLLEGPNRRSREYRIHLGIYTHFPLAGGVIHSQSGHFMAFVATGRPISPVVELAQKFGAIGLARPAKAHSAELAENVVCALEPQKQDLEKHGIATLMPHHGIVVVGSSLDDAFDTLERIENNARTLLLSSLLSHAPPLATRS